MHVNPLNSTAAQSLARAAASQAGAADLDSDQDGAAGSQSVQGHHHRGDGGPGGMMGTMMQTLQQLGLTRSGNTTGATATDARGAMRAFMHDLFQAMQPQTMPAASAAAPAESAGTPAIDAATATSAPPNPAESARGASRYAASSNGLQDLISAMSTTGDARQDTLQADFGRLVTALGQIGGNAAADQTTPTAPSLDAFLQQFLQNVQARNPASLAQMPASGGLVNTIA